MNTIFKGTVNGKEFDNVKDYNEALLKAINSGEPVKATSKTESEEDTEDPNTDLSYLDPSEDIYKDGFLYADRLVNGDEEDDAWAYADERERLEKRRKEILDAVNEHQEDIDVAALVQSYKNAFDGVESDKQNNDATIRILNKKIERRKEDLKDYEEQLKIARHADIVIDLYKEHLNHVITSLQEWLEAPIKDHNETPDTRHEVWPKCCDCTSDEKNSKEGFYDEIMKLMREIFK